MLLYGSAYILKFSRKRNIIKKEKTSMMRSVFNVVANCWVQYNFTKKKFLLLTFSNKSSKIDYQWNITITYFAMFHRILLAKLYTNPLKFRPSRRLVPVHGCNLARLAEFLLFFRPIHNSLPSGIVLVFCLSFFLKRRHKIF